MSLQVDLTAIVNNDESYQFACTYLGLPFNITGYTATLYVKATRTALDSGALTYTIGTGLTVTSAILGEITWAFPHSANTTIGTLWYRLDLILSGVVTTFFYGNFNVLSA